MRGRRPRGTARRKVTLAGSPYARLLTPPACKAKLPQLDAARSPARRLLLDQPVLHRVVDEVDVGVEPELLQDPPAIGAHGAGAQAHFVGDLVQRLARSEQPHDAVFAI